MRSTPRQSECYDPARPGHTPVSGIDLETFADICRQLDRLPPARHDELLGGYGHTAHTWRAVNTVWMARLGQMPYLYEVYERAHGPL